MSAQQFMARHLLLLISSTWRIREEIPDDCADFVRGREIAVIGFWHGKMLPVWYRFRNRGYSAVISGSRDGEILANYLNRSLRYGNMIRGSSSKGGSRVLAEMSAALRERSCLITPDGPRGPALSAKPGALIAAGRSGRPLLLAGWSCRRKFMVRSWDAMEIPFPFSRIVIRYCIFKTSKNIEKNRAETEKFQETEIREIRIGEDDLARFNAALNGIS